MSRNTDALNDYERRMTADRRALAVYLRDLRRTRLANQQMHAQWAAEVVKKAKLRLADATERNRDNDR